MRQWESEILSNRHTLETAVSLLAGDTCDSSTVATLDRKIRIGKQVARPETKNETP